MGGSRVSDLRFFKKLGGMEERKWGLKDSASFSLNLRGIGLVWIGGLELLGFVDRWLLYVPFLYYAYFL